MITRRLTSKSRTIPQAALAALKLSEGDELLYTLEADGRVVISCPPSSAEDPFAAFEEWDSEADRKTYADL